MELMNNDNDVAIIVAGSFKGYYTVHLLDKCGSMVPS